MEKIKSLILRITERCNLKCTYCYAAAQPKPDMTCEMAIKIVQLCCEPGDSLHIQFTGGEPLLNFKVIEDVYNFGKKTDRKLILAIQTNGTLLTPEICRKLHQFQCGIGVSLDGIGKENCFRMFSDGRPAYEEIANGIHNLANENLKCNITTVISSANAENLSKILDASLYFGNIAGIGLDLCRPIGRASLRDCSPSTENLSKGLTKLILKYKELRKIGIPIHLREWDRITNRHLYPTDDCIYCYAQTEKSLAVDGYGDCYPCSSLMGFSSCFLGNIKDGLPTLKRSCLDLNPPDKCIKCPEFNLCKGGCPAMRINSPKNINSLTCQMHNIFSKEWEENL